MSDDQELLARINRQIEERVSRLTLRTIAQQQPMSVVLDALKAARLSPEFFDITGVEQANEHHSD